MPKKETQTTRRATALELRKAGATYEQIAAKLNCSKQNAHKIVSTALREIKTQSDLDAETLKLLELERLDVMQKGLWPAAAKGYHQAVDRVLKIMDRRAKLLALDQTNVRLEFSGNMPAFDPSDDWTEADQKLLDAELGEGIK